MTESQDHPALHAYANIPAFLNDWQFTSIPPLSGPGETLGLEGHIMDCVVLSLEASAQLRPMVCARVQTWWYMRVCSREASAVH